ncbi:hypothetical protein DFAR_2280012 [Desulfarculales bacterium]
MDRYRTRGNAPLCGGRPKIMLSTSKYITVPCDDTDISKRSLELAALLELSNLLC